jgi:hypothetical protein
MDDVSSGFGVVLLIALALFALWARGRRARVHPKADPFERQAGLGPGRSRNFGPGDPGPRHHPGTGRW